MSLKVEVTGVDLLKRSDEALFPRESIAKEARVSPKEQCWEVRLEVRWSRSDTKAMLISDEEITTWGLSIEMGTKLESFVKINPHISSNAHGHVDIMFLEAKLRPGLKGEVGDGEA